MFKKYLEKYVGGGTRYSMTILYSVIFVALCITKTMESVSFATFSGIFGVWIASQHFREHKE